MGTYHWICKSFGWLWTWDGLFHSGKVRCSGERTGKKKTRMFCCDVEKNKTQKNKTSTLRHINISSIFQETTSSYVQTLLLQEKKKLKKRKKNLEVWMKCKKEAGDHLVCFSFFGGKISCYFTRCILQIFFFLFFFSVDVDIDIKYKFLFKHSWLWLSNYLLFISCQ